MNHLLPLDIDLVRSCAKTLRIMYAKRRLIFIELFLRRQSVSATSFDGVDLSSLRNAKLIMVTNGKISPIRRVFPVAGRFIVSDYFTPRHPDNVLPVAEDESIYLARSLDIREGDEVLDVFTGSGIYPIFAAAKAKRATGIDINPKAVNYSKFNAILNGVEHKTEFLLGNMFAPVARRSFDLITANPPYVVVPPIRTRTDALHAESPGDGLDIPRAFMVGAEKHLRPGGRIQMITGSVGSARQPEISFITEQFRGKKVQIDIDYLHRRSISLMTFLRRKFASSRLYYHAPISKPLLLRWGADLKAKGFTNYYFYIVHIRPAKKFTLTTTQHSFQIRKDYYLTTDMSELSLPYVVRLISVYDKHLQHCHPDRR